VPAKIPAPAPVAAPQQHQQEQQQEDEKGMDPISFFKHTQTRGSTSL
jgi:hypothetical protein